MVFAYSLTILSLSLNTSVIKFIKKLTFQPARPPFYGVFLQKFSKGPPPSRPLLLNSLFYKSEHPLNLFLDTPLLCTGTVPPSFESILSCCRLWVGTAPPPMFL